MQTSGLPTRMPTPFADSGVKTTIPVASQIGVTPGRASFTDGFPPLTRTPVAAGGVPPYGTDFNGILNAVTAALRWANAGGQYAFDAAFSAAVGGYPKGAILARAGYDGLWQSTVENNTTNPDTGGAGWINAMGNGVAGLARNSRMSVSAASATATFTCDEILVETAIGGVLYRVSGISKSISLTTVGVGGMDVGTAPVNGYVGVYVIYNPTTGASALLAVNATTAAVGNVYGGANMPAGYSASALVSVWPTNASGLLGVGTQLDRALYIVSTSALSTSVQQSTATALTIAGTVPANAKSCHGTVTLTASVASSNLSAVLGGSSTNVGLVAFSTTSSLANSGIIVPFPDIPLITPQTLYYTNTCSTGTINFGVGISGYTF